MQNFSYYKNLNKIMPKQGKKIKLLTYNIFLRPPPIKTNQDDFKNQRLDDILEQIKNYDIVCFQQLFQTATYRKQKVIEMAILKGMLYFNPQGFSYWKDCEAPSFWSGPPVDSGLLVISKYPILESKFESYNVCILSDGASDKGYIYCKISVEGKILHIFTTHFQASYLHPGMLYERELSIKTRLHQLKTLVKRMKQILSITRKKPTQELVLLMGDLNMNALMVPLKLHGGVLQNQKVGKKFVEYESCMKIFKDSGFKARNCGYQKYKKHPVTFGDGDIVLTDRLQSLSKQSLDYVFHLQLPGESSLMSVPNPELNSPKRASKNTETDSSKQLLIIPDQKCLKPIISSTKVQEFRVKDRLYSQLSDHYGMSIEVAVQ